jgi:hypothetical protein
VPIPTLMLETRADSKGTCKQLVQNLANLNDVPMRPGDGNNASFSSGLDVDHQRETLVMRDLQQGSCQPCIKKPH